MKFTKEELQKCIKHQVSLIPTTDLIAELERRRPCERCCHSSDMAGACIEYACIWQPHGTIDNFKEAK